MVEVVQMAEQPRSPSEKKNLPKDLASVPQFVEMCCKAYSLLRQNAFSLMGLMEMVIMSDFYFGISSAHLRGVTTMRLCYQIFVDMLRRFRDCVFSLKTFFPDIPIIVL